MVELMNQRRKAIADMKAKAKRDKPLTLAQLKEYMRAFVKNQSTAIYTTGWTWKDVQGLTDDQLQNVYNKIRRAVDLATAKDHHQQLKRLGETLESLESKKLKSSHSTEQSAELQETTSVSIGAIIAVGDPISAVPSVSAASSIPAETPIAAGVSTIAGVSDSTSVPIIDLLDSPPKATSLPLDPEIIPTEFGLGEIHVITRAYGTVKRFSTLRELMHWVGRDDLMVLYGMVLDKHKVERATGIGLGLWSDLRTLITAREDRDASIIWDDQDQWEIRS
uniref:Aminoacyl-tRNA synthetase, class 1a, anticodon-binding n=1 Tax=Tanacetum cinerariifolium TaxID=118510 RepID=A0A6L2MFG9_TANCI|nr:aminoacyl-tRNA synthetase, class 1a, anticodon-binding [Tanacetum cinerariifolium]